MFACVECGARSPRWEGRCSRCGAWGSLETQDDESGAKVQPVPLAEVSTEPVRRRPSGSAEFDRVLGGGLVPGSAILVGGEPGIGKSTLLLAIAARIAAGGHGALYVSGEESPSQVAMRAARLGVEKESLLILDSTDTSLVAGVLRDSTPAVCVVDSVQTLTTPGVEGSPGGPAQVRAAAERLVPAARESGSALVLVGQVTKVGGLAGPRTLEHAVDAVLLFEGDRHASVRALRVVKNRFGATDEIGLFEMCDDGLREVRNASDLMLADRRGAGPGSVIGAAVEGRRPLCLEVQALLAGENRQMPRRRGQGVDARRLELIVGVVESLFAPKVASRDVFLNVVGGLSIQDTGLDLAVAAAILGAHVGRAVDPEAVVIGEVGLRGEVRPVPRLAARLKEARAMGFRRAYVPCDTPAVPGIECHEVTRVHDVLPLDPSNPSNPRNPPNETAPPKRP